MSDSISVESTVDDAFLAEQKEREKREDEESAQAAREARTLVSLGRIHEFTDEAVEFSLEAIELRIVSRANSYGGRILSKDGVKIQGASDQRTFIAIDRDRICFKTSRAGTFCRVSFPLRHRIDTLQSGGVAFELPTPILPALTKIDDGRATLIFRYCLRMQMLHVHSADSYLGRNTFNGEFQCNSTDPATVFGAGSPTSHSLGARPAASLRRALEFARLLCRRDVGERKARDITIRDGIVFGGYSGGISWCNHAVLNDIAGNLVFGHAKDLCRLLHKLDTPEIDLAKEGWIEFHEGPISCGCEMGMPGPIFPRIGKSARTSISVDRRTLFYQVFLIGEIARRTKDKSAVCGSVISDGQHRLELRHEAALPRNDNYRFWAAIPAVADASSTEGASRFEFSVNPEDLVTLVDSLDVSEIKIGTSDDGLVFISAAHPGLEGFVGALRDLSKIPVQQKPSTVAR